MEVKALAKFNDLKANQVRTIGEVFEVTNERCKELNSTSHGVLVEVIKEKKMEEIKNEQNI